MLHFRHTCVGRLGSAKAGAVAVLFAFLFAGRITTPVREMTRASQAMARGDLDQTFPSRFDQTIRFNIEAP